MKTKHFKPSILISLLVLFLSISKAEGEGISHISESKQFLITQSSDQHQELNLIDSDNEIKHVFHITLSEKDYKKMSKTKNLDKDYISNCTITYNNDTLSLKAIALRGKSSMEYKRKSLSINLDSVITINKDGIEYTFKKFNLNCLSMDQNYFRNKVAFDLMKQLGLFNLFYTYAEVVINGETQGVYLMVQKPKNYAFKKEGSNVMLRRDYASGINRTYYKGDDSSIVVKCEEVFSKIYNEILLKSGSGLYNELSEVLDVNQYFRWMAFNYLIGNRDYTDEVFFFNKMGGDTIKFGVIPWDYDDIFYDQPREGYVVRYVNFGDKLAFSSEDDLDFKLVTDDYTYSKYQESLKDLVNSMPGSMIKDVFESTYQELFPYFTREDILKMSKVDKYGKTDLLNLKTDMNNIYKKLLQKREATVNAITP